MGSGRAECQKALHQEESELAGRNKVNAIVSSGYSRAANHKNENSRCPHFQAPSREPSARKG